MDKKFTDCAIAHKAKGWHKLLGVFAALMLLLPLVACGDTSTASSEDSAESSALVIIVGKHSNANFSAAYVENLQSLIEQSFVYGYDETYGKYTASAQVSVIVSDGNPTACDLSSLTLSSKSNTQTNRTMLVEEMTEELIAYICSDAVMADDEEVDLLAALSEAALILNETGAAEKYIAIIDTGVTTTGHFNMVSMDMQGSAQEIVAQIPSTAFPDLSNIIVQMTGLGNTANPQSILRGENAFATKFVDTWNIILVDECNATLSSELLFSSSQGEAMCYLESGEGYPYVTTVVFEATSAVDIGTEEGVTVLTSAQLGFNANEATFRDEAVALQHLGTVGESVQEYLCNNPDEFIYVVGSIAKTSEDEDITTSHSLSEARAQVVANLLIQQYDVDPAKVVVVDAGTTSFSWRDAEEFLDGVVDPTAQQSNRCVAIFGSSSASLVSELSQAGYL